MANIPLKSIKFPGLDDTYTVPQVDDTLTKAGEAADAKKAGDEVASLKSAIDLGCITTELKTALLQLASKVAYIDDDGQDYYDDLYAALYDRWWTVTNTLTECTTSNASVQTLKGEPYTATITASAGYQLTGATVSVTMGGTDITATAYSNGVIFIPAVTGALVITISAAAAAVSSISAVFTQGGNTVWESDELDSLKQYLVVTATFYDTSTVTVPSADYTLSGTLTSGLSTITVTYSEKTTAFTVTVTGYTWLYKASSGQLLSAQNYVTQSTAGNGGTESLVSGALRLHTDFAPLPQMNLLRFNFSDTSTTNGVIRAKVKLIDMMMSTSGSSGFRLQLSNGTTGAQAFFLKEDDYITVIYFEGTTKETLATTFTVADYHVMELRLSNGHQTFSIDGTQVFDTSTLADNYTTVNSILNQGSIPDITPNGVTTDIAWIGYLEVS